MTAENKSFEFYMKELDRIIAEMEGGNLDQLEKLIKNFEHGSEIIDKCNKILKEAELRVHKSRELGAKSRETEASNFADEKRG